MSAIGDISLFQVNLGKEWGDSQIMSYYLAKQLCSRGVQSWLVVHPKSPLHCKAMESRIPVLQIHMLSRLDGFAIMRLALAMRKMKCLLIHTHDSLSISLSAVAARIANVPLKVISNYVDSDHSTNIVKHWNIKKNYDAIISVSEDAKNTHHVSRLKSNFCKVVHVGRDFSVLYALGKTDCLRKEFDIPRDDFLIGIITNLSDKKGFQYLIEELTLLQRYAPMINFVILGKGPLDIEADMLKKELNDVELVFFLKSMSEWPKMMASLDALILSSDSEGFESTAMTAMALGLPIVVVQKNLPPAIIKHGETGLRVESGKRMQMAHFTYRLYRDRNFASLLGNMGFENVKKNFSVESSANKIIGIYEIISAQKGFQIMA